MKTRATELRVMGWTSTVQSGAEAVRSSGKNAPRVRLGEVFQAYQAGTRPWGTPRSRWRDYTFHLVLSYQPGSRW